MKKAIISISTIALLIVLISCGGSSPTTRPTTTGLSKRVFLTNQFFNDVNIIDATKDVFGINLISAGTGPTILATQPGKKTLVYLSGSQEVGIIDNATESLTGRVGLSAPTESMAVSSDGTKGYVAVHNTSQLVVIDLANKGIMATVTTNLPWHKLVLSPNGMMIAGFTDTTNSVEIIPFSGTNSLDLTGCATTTPCTISANANWVPAIGGLDRPTNGLFSADSATLYILNCGDECGGTTAGVAAYNIAGGSVTATTSTPTPATIGILDSSNLYVAGTSPTGAGVARGGTITRLNPTTLAVTGGPGPLPDGIHDTIAAQGGKIFVGARGCNATLSCLGIYNPSANTTQIDTIDAVNAPNVTPGDVTGMTAISGRTVVYVVVGGELRFYDSSTSALTANQLDIVGKAVDAKLVD